MLWTDPTYLPHRRIRRAKEPAEPHYPGPPEQRHGVYDAATDGGGGSKVRIEPGCVLTRGHILLSREIVRDDAPIDVVPAGFLRRNEACQSAAEISSYTEL